jgi:hypothetical protein
VSVKGKASASPALLESTPDSTVWSPNSIGLEAEFVANVSVAVLVRRLCFP